MSRRYLWSLLVACTVFALLFAGAVLPIELGRGHSLLQAMANLLPVAAGLGLLNTALLALSVGPLIVWLQARWRQRLAPWRAAAIGASSFPLLPLAMSVLFSDDNETFVELLRYWWRVPGELLIGVLPAIASGAVFGATLSSTRQGDQHGTSMTPCDACGRDLPCRPQPTGSRHFTSSSSTSNTSVAFGGMTPPAPRAP